MEQTNGIFWRLKQDLMPYPGKLNQVLRTVLACTITIIVCQTLQISWPALSLIAVFYVSQSNVLVTQLTCVFFIIVVTFAIGLALILLNITWNVPLLRILSTAIILLFSVFLMRASPYGMAFFIVNIVISYSQTFVDLTSSSETAIRSILWVWVAVNYAICITFIVNSLLLPAEPTAQLKQVELRQLDMIIQALDSKDARSHVDAGAAGRDMQSLYRLLRYSVMRNSEYKRQESQHLARISTLSELRALSCQLPITMDTLADLQAAEALKKTCQHMRDAIANNTSDSPTHVLDTGDEHAILKNMAHILNDYYYGEEAPKLAQDNKKMGFFSPDAFSNPVYRIFALKTVFIALLCYFIYVGTNWPGIHTIMLSSLIVAQPGLGNIQRKIILRLIGAALGSLIALLSIVFILPHIDTIFGLLMLSIPVLALSAWVTTGPESISYAGIQIMFTFALAVLETFSRVTDLTEVRDRIVGIIAGIIIAGIIHTLICPEREGQTLLSRLAELMSKACKGLSLSSKTQDNSTEVMTSLAECETIASRVALEPAWNGTEGAHDIVYLRLHGLLLRVKSIVMLINHLALLSSHLPDNCQAEATQVLQECQIRLDNAKNWLLGNAEHANLEKIILPESLPLEFRQTVTSLANAVQSLYRLPQADSSL